MRISLGCSTFAIADAAVIGHNADIQHRLPGAVVVNPRGMPKRSISFDELATGRPSAPVLEWESRFGSLTFNPLGVEFADGGVNEAGLCVAEMTLEGSVFPPAEGRPVLFMAQWIQSMLDRFATVSEALDDLSSIALDGWAWHFFLRDRTGDVAVVEFLDGSVVVHRGPSLPYAVLCNTAYAEQTRALGAFEPFGGTGAVDLEDQEVERYVHAAYMAALPASSDEVSRAFSMLRTLERGRTQWSWVVDDRTRTVHWRTSLSPGVKVLRLGEIDWSVRSVLDVDSHLPGDAAGRLEPLGDGWVRRLADFAVATLDAGGGFTMRSRAGGSSHFELAERLAAYAIAPSPVPAPA